MKLAYRAFDKSGKEVADTIEAGDLAEATESLRQRGLYVTDLAEASGAAGPPRRRRTLLPGRSRRLKDLAMFTRQLCVLVASGTPLVQALGALKRQAQNAQWRETIGRVCKSVEEGSSLAEAMGEHPDYFDTIYCNLITAGESGGDLLTMLERLARLTRKRMQVRNSVLAAIAYPCLLMVVVTGVMAVLLGLVIPQFAMLFATLDVPLPPTTRVMIGFSGLVRSYWWAGLMGLVALAAGARLWLTSPAGKGAMATAILRLPKLGQVVRSLTTARIVRLLGVLLGSHVPVLEALRLTREGMANVHYADLLRRTEEAVTRGESISSAFSRSDLISPSICEAINSGEQSGQIASLLLTVADFLDDENDLVMRSLASIVEPMILILMGVVVCFVAVSMFMPLFDLTAIAAGGAG